MVVIVVISCSPQIQWGDRSRSVIKWWILCETSHWASQLYSGDFWEVSDFTDILFDKLVPCKIYRQWFYPLISCLHTCINPHSCLIRHDIVNIGHGVLFYNAIMCPCTGVLERIKNSQKALIFLNMLRIRSQWRPQIELCICGDKYHKYSVNRVTNISGIHEISRDVILHLCTKLWSFLHVHKMK